MSRSRDFGSAAGSLAAPASSNNGYAHVVDTTQASSWNLSPLNNFNWFVNGGLDYWQRGTTWTADARFIADRWFVTGATTGGGQSTDVPTNQGLSYSVSVVASSGSGYPRLAYYMPANEAAFLATKTVTLSFWAKSVSGTSILYVEQQTPTSANLFNAGANGWGSKIIWNSGSPVTSWQYYTFTFVVNAAAATNGLTVNFVRGTDSGSSTLFAGIKLELGSVATPFSRSGYDLQGELQKCQRYYWRTATSAGTTYNRLSSYTPATTTTVFYAPVKLPVTMRATPNYVNGSGLTYYDGVNVVSTAVSLGLVDSTPDVAVVGVTTTGLTQFRSYVIMQSNNAAGYMEISAEVI
jgi:hypothetical protein